MRTALLLLTLLVAPMIAHAEPVDGYPIGWCVRAKPEAFADAKSAGFEYVELALQDVHSIPDADFETLKAQFESHGLRALSGYNPIPKELKIVGPDVDQAKLDEHLRRLFARAAALKLQYLIFNSGNAWRVPDGMSPEEGFSQLTQFSRRLATEAAKHNITVLVQPLRNSDSNQITTIADALKLVDAVNHPNFALMVDYSFLVIQKDDFNALLQSPKALRHVHLSNPANKRTYPMSDEESDYASFFAVLKKIGYRGGLSVHGSTTSFATDAPRAITFLRSKAAELSNAPAGDGATSEWVKPGPDGKLLHKTTSSGDRIMDFSHAGYMGGGVAIPDVPVKQTVKPSGGEDDTKVIQAAIDEVAKLPPDDRGFRGAVLLAPGTFNCPETITIPASGVVLRGSSASGERKSTIKMTGKPHLALAVRRPGARRGNDQAATREADLATAHIADAYVPSGAMSFNVTDAKGFAVGDVIEIRRPVTEAWVRFMQMHDMTRNGKPQTWIRAGATTDAERRIAAIERNTIALDVPLSDSFDQTYLEPPGTVVAKITPRERLSQVGIENLHVESPPQEISHSQDHHTALRMNGQDCWVRDVIIDETMNSVSIGGRRITLQRVAINRKAKHQGASKPAEFAPNGSQVLLDRCSVSADNVWYVATGGGISGPIVVLNCTFTGQGRAESHQRWSTGMLYDNVRVPDGAIELRNRGSMGSGHGWSMGWGVVWNCVAEHYIVQNPPGALNWLIGCVGANELSPRPFGSGPNLPEGVIDSPGKPVTPRSLYLTQMKQRLGEQALTNIGYGSDDDIKPSDRSAKSHDEDRKDLALNRPVTTSNVRNGDRKFAGWNALDADDSTYWATDDATTKATLELDTEGAIEVNAVELGEAGGFENRVRGYKVEGMVDSDWKLLAQGTSIGRKKLERFPKVTVWKVRLSILDAEGSPAIKNLSLYLDPTS